jgi:hypothetical protein
MFVYCGVKEKNPAGQAKEIWQNLCPECPLLSDMNSDCSVNSAKI